MDKLRVWVRDNVVGLVSLAVDLGLVAWLKAEWDDVTAAFWAYPEAVAAVAVFCFGFGFLVACLFGLNSYASKRAEARMRAESDERAAKERRDAAERERAWAKEDAAKRVAEDRLRHDNAVRRMCDVLSNRQKQMLRAILDGGTGRYDATDRDAEVLAESGLTTYSRLAATGYELVISVNPVFVDDLRAHPELLS